MNIPNPIMRTDPGGKASHLMARFQVVPASGFFDICDLDLCDRSGTPLVVRGGMDSGSARALAASLNSSRGSGVDEVRRALYPTHRSEPLVVAPF